MSDTNPKPVSDDIISGSHLTKVVRHGSVYLLSNLVLRGGAAIVLPIYTHTLDADEYGRYTNLMAVAGIAGILMSFQVDYAYSRLVFDAREKPEFVRKLFSTLAVFLLGWGGLAAMVIYLLVRPTLAETLAVPYMPHALLAFVIPIFLQLNLLAQACCTTRHQSTRVTTAQLLTFFGGAIVSIALLLTTEMKALALLWGALCGAVLSFVYYYALIWRDGLIGYSFSGKLLRESLLYALPLLPGASSAWVAGQFDKLMVTWRGDLAESGMYSVSFEIGRVMNIFAASLFMVYTPMIYAMLKDNARQNIRRIEQFQAFYIHALLGLAFMVSVFTPEAYYLLIDKSYHSGISIVPLIAFAFVFSGLRKLHATLIFYHKLTWLVAFGGIMQAVVSFGLNYFLIPSMGGMAAGWSRLISMLLAAIYFYILSRKYEPLRIDWSALSVTLSVFGGAAAILAILAFGLQLPFGWMLAAKILMVLLIALITWRSRFGDDVRSALAQQAASRAAAPVADTIGSEEDDITP